MAAVRFEDATQRQAQAQAPARGRFLALLQTNFTFLSSQLFPACANLGKPRPEFSDGGIVLGAVSKKAADALQWILVPFVCPEPPFLGTYDLNSIGGSLLEPTISSIGRPKYWMNCGRCDELVDSRVVPPKFKMEPVANANMETASLSNTFFLRLTSSKLVFSCVLSVRFCNFWFRILKLRDGKVGLWAGLLCRLCWPQQNGGVSVKKPTAQLRLDQFWISPNHVQNGHYSYNDIVKMDIIMIISIKSSLMTENQIVIINDS